MNPAGFSVSGCVAPNKRGFIFVQDDENKDNVLVIDISEVDGLIEQLQKVQQQLKEDNNEL